MSAAYTAAARSLFRSAAVRNVGSRVATASAPKYQPKSSAVQSPFGLPKRNTGSHPARILRSPVEMSCCVESLFPYHTATASALLTSMLSATPRRFGWTLEDCNDDV